MNSQISFFDGSAPLKIDKPIRLIELFAGYGSQHLALKYLGASVESHRICEWAVKSIQAYKDLHMPDDDIDYSILSGMTKDELIDWLYAKGISADYNQPITANGQTNWTGSFISPDIDHIERSTEIGGNAPTRIYMKDGSVYENDGDNISPVPPESKLVQRAYERFYERNGRVPEMFNAYNDTEITDVAPAQKVNCRLATSSSAVLLYRNMRIRRLTPRECGRLMGVRDEDITRMAVNQSDSALYHMYGDAICVDCMMHIFRMML